MSWYWDKNIIVPLGISPLFHLSQVLVVILGSERMEEASCYSKSFLIVSNLLSKFPCMKTEDGQILTRVKCSL